MNTNKLTQKSAEVLQNAQSVAAVSYTHLDVYKRQVETVADEILLLKEGHLQDKGSVPYLIDKYAPGENLEQVYLNIFGEEGKH